MKAVVWSSAVHQYENLDAWEPGCLKLELEPAV